MRDQTVPMSYCPNPLAAMLEWTRQMSAAVRQAHYWDNRGGDSGQAANAPNSPIETLIYGLFQFQIVAWVARPW